MSRKIKFKNSNRRRRKFTQKTKASVGGSDAANEYTVILLEKSNIEPNKIQKKIEEEIKEKIEEEIKKEKEKKDKAQKEVKRLNGTHPPLNYEETKKSIATQENIIEETGKKIEIYKKFCQNALEIIKSGLHIGKESINNSTFINRIRKQRNTSDKKYLGIVLDLTHFVKETSLDGSEIIRIFRKTIMEL
tara:strand:- start:144 stop:713 length:570 start_codon:yes stop_codon:yes gene_type:complete